MSPIYLDNAATTPLHPEVLEAMLPFLKENFGNPSAIHSIGRKARTAVERSRKTIANSINASTGEIFFTSSATEGNNMVLTCCIRDLEIKHLITSPIEHHCVLHTAEHLAEKGKIELHLVAVDELGRVVPESLEKKLSQIEGKTLVSIMNANNEIGTINDIKTIGQICKQHGAYLHSDTVQTFCHYPIDLQELDIDFMVGSAHKFHGPKGIGFLYINGDIKLSPMIVGGSQERNMRAGTENVPGIIGMGKAVEVAQANLTDDHNYILGLKRYMQQKLVAKFEGIQFNGDVDGNSLYTVLNTSFPPHPKNDMLLINLDIAGICASGGSACSSGVDAGSHVLNHLAVDTQRANVRFSFSTNNTKTEIDFVVEKLCEILG